MYDPSRIEKRRHTTAMSQDMKEPLNLHRMKPDSFGVPRAKQTTGAKYPLE